MLFNPPLHPSCVRAHVMGEWSLKTMQSGRPGQADAGSGTEPLDSFLRAHVSGGGGGSNVHGRPEGTEPLVELLRAQVLGFFFRIWEALMADSLFRLLRAAVYPRNRWARRRLVESALRSLGSGRRRAERIARHIP
jgi:hypothetical protein